MFNICLVKVCAGHNVIPFACDFYVVTLMFSLESFKSNQLSGDTLNGFKFIFALALFNIVGLTGRFTPITV